MINGPGHLLLRVERVALGVAGVAAIAAVLLGLRAPEYVVPAWRLAIFACLQPAIGSLLFVLIHRLTGGHWMERLGPFLLSGTRLLPWVWLLVLPLLAFPIAANPAALASGSTTASVASATASVDAKPVVTTDFVAATNEVFSTDGSRHLGTALRWYLSRRLVVARAIIYGAAFFLLAFGASRAFGATTTLRWFGPAGLIGSVFLLHLLMVDWFNSLDPGWYSTGAPLVWITAQAIAGLAIAVASAVLSGTRPADPASHGRPRGLDWGNLLLAALMSWAYVAFVQLLIIWSGNLPAETAWYRHRSSGVWKGLLIAFAVIEFGAPFVLLLSRPVKRGRGSLVLAAVLLLVGQLTYTSWLIAPAFPAADRQAPWLLAAVVIAAVGLFLNRYLAGARTIAARLAP